MERALNVGGSSRLEDQEAKDDRSMIRRLSELFASAHVAAAGDQCEPD
jgi:hypothetical protein